MAWAEGPGGAVGGTREALYLPHRLPWEQIAAARWDEEEGLLRVTEVAPWGVVPPSHEVPLDGAMRLLQLVRERVTATIVLQRQVPLSGRHGARIFARRPPHSTAPLAWFVEYDEGLDPADPAVREQVDAALAVARSDVGE
ncbi:hypothetical protein FXB39_08665 [Nocardioides sp. BGMRC 2183]|nr:hypothetical protein FXB39_08665 [Nocardioides sp. BGMRC 2183]